MLNLLTKYLLQYKRLILPSLGTIRLVQQPAVVNKADNVMLPPSFIAEIGPEETIPDHQLLFLSAALQQDKAEVKERLRLLGGQLDERIRRGGFYWKGIGLIREGREPVQLSLPALNPVPVAKPLRQETGAKSGAEDQAAPLLETAPVDGVLPETTGKKRSVFVVIGWVLLALSVLFIFFILYQGKFRIGSTGSKQAPTGSIFLQQPGGVKAAPPGTGYPLV